MCCGVSSMSERLNARRASGASGTANCGCEIKLMDWGM